MKRDIHGRAEIVIKEHEIVAKGWIVDDIIEHNTDTHQEHYYPPFLAEWSIRDHRGNDILDYLSSETKNKIKDSLLNKYFEKQKKNKMEKEKQVITDTTHSLRHLRATNNTEALQITNTLAELKKALKDDE